MTAMVQLILVGALFIGVCLFSAKFEKPIQVTNCPGSEISEEFDTRTQMFTRRIHEKDADGVVVVAGLNRQCESGVSR